MSDPEPWSSTLSGFPIRALQAHLAPNGSVECDLAAQMFVGIDKDAMLDDPGSLDIGSRTLVGFLTASLPRPLNESRPGSMLEWWMDSAVNDPENTTSFLRSLAGTCSEAICAEAGDGLDPDVSGVGILISNAMLTVVALLFFTFTLFHVHTRANRSDRGRHSCATNAICAALRGTIEDVFDATLVFSLALHVATLDFRSRGATRSDVLYAESLCTFVGLACLTMWHMRASISREKWTTRAAFWGMCALNVAVYVLRQLPHKQALDLYGPLCETGTEEAGMWFLEPFAMVYWVACLAMAVLPLRGTFEWARGRPLAHSEVTRWRMWQAFWGVGAMIVHIFMLGSTRNKHLATQSWGIGQYLAVATWLPALLKMGYIINVGAEVGLTASLPRPWIALLLEDDPESSQSTPSASMRIWSRGVSLMGLPAFGFSSWRRRSSQSDDSVDQETQSSGITETADKIEDKKVASLQDTKSGQCGNIREEETSKGSPRRRDTDDTLVGGDFEEDEVCLKTSKVQDKDKIWAAESKDCQIFEEPEEVDE